MITNKTYIGSPDDPRTTAIVAYITSIGWVIAYFFLYRKNKSTFPAYHLRQSLLIHICSLLIKVAYSFTLYGGLAVFIILVVLALLLFFIWLKSFLHALNGEMRPAPFIGTTAERLFHGLR